MRRLQCETKDYLEKILKVIDEECHTSINLYDHKDTIHKSISIFNSYKAKVITVNLSGKKDDNIKKSSDSNDEPSVLCEPNVLCIKKKYSSIPQAQNLAENHEEKFSQSYAKSDPKEEAFTSTCIF